ncbi:ribosomal protein S18-alanine N-acetyltransferase [Natranaerobius trueperi]|uniref:Ribosomal-protein-alanine N-acetyltransferase n=1 Tax=Natranaerobius trueperi TaxID=759412 RepID=A0A226C2X3_9FIRM|nr:ribosomal protein S18-alanine N-acetyltransferase [Natranaerobius trueperi]OWZ84799.1 ribosomal-protein-alanine N-acetyltransferase [Natranaerobius trueperi]
MIEKTFSDYSIRGMVKDDISKVMEIEKCSFNSPWSENAFFHELEKNFLATYFVFEHIHEEGKELFAYGGYWLIQDDCHITNIAVDPNYRGIGVGRVVLISLLTHAKERGATRATLEVRKSNESAIRLYQKLGFEQLGIRPNYYQDNNEDAIIMYKIIEK